MNQALNGQSAAMRPRRQSAEGFPASGSGHHQSEGLHAHHLRQKLHTQYPVFLTLPVEDLTGLEIA
jgi:hypothetical protein